MRDARDRGRGTRGLLLGALCRRTAGSTVLALALVGLSGCGTALNLTGLSLIDDPTLRPASFMGGTRYDTHLLKHGGRDGRCVGMMDAIFSIAADLCLLPVTIPLAALCEDGPFAPAPPSGTSAPARAPGEPPRTGPAPTSFPGPDEETP